MRPTLLRPLLLLPLLLAAACADAQSIHDRIYQPQTAPLSVAGLPRGATLDQVRTADGLLLRGVEVAGAADKPVLLVFHGNASSADRSVEWFAPLVAEGYGVVAAEYRGYSGNPGRPDAKSLAADADAFYARARALAGTRRVIVVGHSLGGGVAFGLATRQRLDALVTVGTFTRLRAMAPKIARAFVPDDYDNLAAVPTLDEPYFLIHGTADDVVPAQLGNALHVAAAKAHKAGASFVIAGGGHHPDAAVMAAIVDTIAARVAGTAAPALPASVKVYPFGQ
ncbi:alpha/beta fold hydrolase [Sphingomonas sp. PB2P19]|uniref:alpha/beta hydrolase n=1 Tax=Sphingomonas rhamnosi TaxID=3096156 RepID=UPI002FCC3665